MSNQFTETTETIKEKINIIEARAEGTDYLFLKEDAEEWWTLHGDLLALED